MKYQIIILLFIIIYAAIFLGGIKYQEHFATSDLSERSIFQVFNNENIMTRNLMAKDKITIGAPETISLNNNGLVTAKKICINEKCTENGFQDDTFNGIRFTNSMLGNDTNYGELSEIANDTREHKALVLAGNNTSGDKRVAVMNHLDVKGKLTVNGNEGIKGKLIEVASADGKTKLMLMNSGDFSGIKINGNGNVPLGFSLNNTSFMNINNDNIFFSKPLVMNDNDGVLIEKINNREAKRYGIEKKVDTVRIYTTDTGSLNTAGINMSFSKRDGTYDDVLLAKNSGDVVIKNKICIKDTCLTEQDLKNVLKPPPPCFDNICMNQDDMLRLKDNVTTVKTQQLCLGGTCANENDITRLKDKDKMCIGGTCLNELELGRLKDMLNRPAVVPTPVAVAPVSAAPAPAPITA